MILTPSLYDKVLQSETLSRLKTESTLEWDNSTFTTWQACQLKGCIFSCLKKVSANNQAPLRFGDAVHVGIAERLSGKSDEEALKAAIERANENRLDECFDERRNRRKLVELLTSYFLFCDTTNGWIRPVVFNGKPLVEQGFLFPLGSVVVDGLSYLRNGLYKINWKGKIDVIERFQGDVCIVDHKTTTVMGEKFLDDKIRGSQMLGYTWAGNLIAAQFGETVKRVRINALAQRSGGFEFKMFSIPYPAWVIEEWQRETLLACANHIRMLDAFICKGRETARVVPNRESCVTKYGRCAYFEACETVPAAMERMLNEPQLFVDNNWDPLKE